MKRDKIRLSFEIRKFEYDPKLITEKVGLKPTESYVKGDIKLVGPNDGRPKAQVKFHNNIWSLDPDTPSSAPFEDQLDSLLQKLAPYKDKLVAITKDCEANIRVTLLMADPQPFFFLSAERIRLMADLGISLSLDVSFLGKS